MPRYIYTDFTPNAVQPIECFKEGFSLIKPQYWLFVGISLVALLLGQLAPLGILMPPMMCGVYVVLFERMRGETVEFGTLFTGFDYFGPGIIAMLLHLLPIFAVMIPAVVLLVITGAVIAPSAGNEPSGSPAMTAVIVLIVICAVIVGLLATAVSVLFTFAYPLIVERKLGGGDAVKLSFKATLANFWPVVGLVLLNAVVVLAGALCCYVGAFLVLPIGFAATACAYRQVFGVGAPAYLPPPPPSFR